MRRYNPQAKRTPAQRAADYAFERECDNQCMSHKAIATALAKIRPYRICRQMVDKDFNEVERMYRETAVGDLAAHRQRDIEILEWLCRELAEQWKRSCQDATSETVETGLTRKRSAALKGKKPKIQPGKRRITSKGQCGDPAFAARIVEVRARIAKLRGLDAPERHELAGANQGPIVTAEVPLDRLTDEELERIVQAGKRRLLAEHPAAPGNGIGS